MNELFEAYIAARLKEALHHHGINVLTQQQDSLAEGGRIRIIPDLIIQSHDGREIIMDTKYKQKKDDARINNDVFQMVAYRPPASPIWPYFSTLRVRKGKTG